jgi:hypothetical protein
MAVGQPERKSAMSVDYDVTPVCIIDGFVVRWRA